MAKCLVLLPREDAAGMKDDLGKHEVSRVPLIGEEIEIHSKPFRVTRVIHTPEEKYDAKLYVSY